MKDQTSINNYNIIHYSPLGGWGVGRFWREHMVFRGYGGGYQSSPTEYKEGYRKLTAN